MSLEDIVTVAITAQTTTPSRLGFGTPLIARYHTAISSLVRAYKNLTAITDDGFPAADPAVLMATKIFSQNPKPASLKIGKRTSAFTQTIDLTPINATEGYVYAGSVVVGATTTAISYTVPAAATVASVVTALTALFDAVSGISATDNTTKLTVATDVAGDLVDYVGWSEFPDDMSFKDVTADPGIAADLTAIETVDPTGWYALFLDSNSEAEILATAAWVEARKKIFLTNTSDTDVVDNVSTTDVMSDLQSFAYSRTSIMYSQVRLLNWSGAAWGGKQLPTDPGSSTWAYKTLAGVQVDGKLTGGQASVIESKGGNHYTVIAGVNVTRYGVMASGEYIDIVRGIDWLDQRIKERIFGVLINNAKIPFTDLGVDVMRNEIIAQLQQAIAVGLLAAEPAPVVTAPKVADISAADKASRCLPDVFFQGTLAGAIHKIEIAGVLSV